MHSFNGLVTCFQWKIVPIINPRFNNPGTVSIIVPDGSMYLYQWKVVPESETCLSIVSMDTCFSYRLDWLVNPCFNNSQRFQS